MMGSLFATGQMLSEVRKEFHKAVLDPGYARNFHEFIKDYDGSSGIIHAYRAVSEAMIAPILWNPFAKLAQVRKYRAEMELAVLKNPESIEIRFLRLAIEHHLPSFLGMSDHLEEDLAMIMENHALVAEIELDPDYHEYILYFLEHTKLCSSDQIARMKQSIGDEFVQRNQFAD